MATLIDFLNKLNELERLRNELKLRLFDKYNNIIEIEADIDAEDNPYFLIVGEHFQTSISLSEMRKFAEWLRSIGILEIKEKERDGRG